MTAGLRPAEAIESYLLISLCCSVSYYTQDFYEEEKFCEVGWPRLQHSETKMAAQFL